MNIVMIDEKVYKESELAVLKESGLSVAFRNGDNNVVSICSPYFYKNFNITISGEGNQISIQKGSKIFNTYVGLNTKMSNIKINIGKDFCCYGANINAVNDEDILVIGDNCEFSSGIYMSTQDLHSIFDIHTHNILNFAKKVEIGNNVYLGYKTTVMKDIVLGSNIIAMPYSVITKSFSENYLQIGGHPAMVIRRNVARKKNGNIEM